MEYNKTTNIKHAEHIAMLHECISELDEDMSMVEKLTVELSMKEERIMELENINKELNIENKRLRKENFENDKLRRYFQLRYNMVAEGNAWGVILEDIDAIVEEVNNALFIYDCEKSECLEYLTGDEVFTKEEIIFNQADSPDNPDEFWEDFLEENHVIELPWTEDAGTVDGRGEDDTLYWVST
jgi:hypothetical protein